MYLYQDCVRLGQKLRNEKEKQQVFKNISLVELKDVQVREERQGEQDEFHMINVLKFGERQHQTCDTTPQSPSFECKCENVKSARYSFSTSDIEDDKRSILKSFNPMCRICKSDHCTTAFNSNYKTCSHYVFPLKPAGEEDASKNCC